MENETKKPRRRKKAEPKVEQIEAVVKEEPVVIKEVKKSVDGYTVDSSYTVVARKGLNVRKGTSTTTARVKTLVYGTKVVCKDITKSGSDTWMQIADGWVLANHGVERYVK